MQRKSRGRIVWGTLLLIVVAMLASGGLLLFNAQRTSQPVLSHPHRSGRATIAPQDARLIIPSIHVDAPIESVGVLADGTMGVPTKNQWQDVAWYHGGPHPGDVGSAVIGGHLDRPGGSPAVFWYLRNVHAGDLVNVVDAQGKIHHFRVSHTAYYTPQDAPLQEIFGRENGTFLNLTTCAGTWIPSQHQTTLRLIVYTVLV